MTWLRYAAGPRARSRLRASGLTASDVSAMVLPATGPKWLVGAGFDRALIDGGWFTKRSTPLALLGASAGSWRALAFASRDPSRAHAALIDAYCAQRFTRQDSPEAISRAYRALLDRVFSEDDIAHAIGHSQIDLAITAVRARGPFIRSSAGLRAILGATAVLNAGSTRALSLFFDRVVFHARAGREDAHPIFERIHGVRHALTSTNARLAALASGSVPFYMQPVAIPDAPNGLYLDGGLSDYHLSQRLEAANGVVLLFLHQRRIVSAWLDKILPWRSAEASLLTDVLLVYPDPSFVRELPGGTIPTREDFHRMMASPEDRIARWHAAVDRSRALGEAFLEDVAKGAIGAKIEALA